MELDFDNEIDALLREEARGRTITISEFAGLHLDTDEIAAFAENAVPERARLTFIEHFAACDMCRKTLSHAISLSAEVPETAPAVAAPAEIAVAWYRRLFLFPNLAYVMGGLVVLFAGFIGLSVLNSFYRSASTDVSRISEAPAVSAPSQDYSMNANAMSAPAASSNASAAANAVSNAAATNSMSANTTANTVTVKKAPDFSLDEETAKHQPAAAAPPPKDQQKEVTVTDIVGERANQESRTKLAAAAEKERKREEDQKMMPRATPVPSGPVKMKSPARNERRDTRAAEPEFSMRKSDNLPATGRSVRDFNKKQVSGRTFEFRQGAWYDTTYRGQGTINVRRHTDNYRKLDRGLRGIAENFFGTVVTIWNGKAYRIQ